MEPNENPDQPTSLESPKLDDAATASPEETRKMIIFSACLGILLLLVFFVPTFLRDREERRILRDGVATTARVKDIRPTGDLHNDQPEVRIIVEVTAEAGEPFEAEITTFMSPVYLPRFQPGAVVEVRFDPNDRRKVALVGP